MADLISPETIPFQPLPNAAISSVVSDVATSSSKAVGAPATIPPRKLPQKIVAMETISGNFDTYLKRIIGDFKFAPLGAISLGQYSNGASGDMRLSSDGLQARNVNGDTTVLIDVLTGNAFFMGEIQAGTLISGGVNVKDSSIQIDGENGRIVFYDGNIPAIVIGNRG